MQPQKLPQMPQMEPGDSPQLVPGFHQFNEYEKEEDAKPEPQAAPTPPPPPPPAPPAGPSNNFDTNEYENINIKYPKEDLNRLLVANKDNQELTVDKYRNINDNSPLKPGAYNLPGPNKNAVVNNEALKTAPYNTEVTTGSKIGDFARPERLESIKKERTSISEIPIAKEPPFSDTTDMAEKIKDSDMAETINGAKERLGDINSAIESVQNLMRIMELGGRETYEAVEKVLGNPEATRIAQQIMTNNNPDRDENYYLPNDTAKDINFDLL